MIYTYILETESNEYYCGKTNNVHRRIQEHKRESYPHWFCNNKRKNFKVAFITEEDYEKKIKKFGAKNFMQCILNQHKRFAPP